MFVLVTVWEELSDRHKKLSLPEKIAFTLKHAGVSITVTSLTDIMAFAVGSFTVNLLILKYRSPLRYFFYVNGELTQW